jgi:hypothetical protein
VTDVARDAISPEHLTDVLRRAGVLARGQVRSVAVLMSRQTLISTVMRLHLEGDGDPGALPLRLFFKTRRPDSAVTADAIGRKEVDFYTRVAPLTPAGLLPRCFDAAQTETGWHLLLEDFSDSHGLVTDWPLPPTLAQCDRMLGAVGRFHGFWWDDARLGSSIGTFRDAGPFDRYVSEFPRQLSIFVDRLGDNLSPERRRVLERFMASASRRFSDRYSAHRNLTIVHGDVHVWNLLYPRDPDRDHVRIIDWDAWRIDVATDDLAYMMALHWYPETRRRLERECLRRYHAALAAAGVAGYDVDALWQDYRQSTLWHLATPVWQATHGIPPWIWWSHLERIMLAVDDLGCLDLLD